jgi:uncharacterized protein (DUF4415 family)
MKKIKRAPKDILTDEDLKPENIKANITIRISGDVLDAYRTEAKRLGIGYQTLMQMKLKEGLERQLERRIEALERKFNKHG